MTHRTSQFGQTFLLQQRVCPLRDGAEDSTFISKQVPCLQHGARRFPVPQLNLYR